MKKGSILFRAILALVLMIGFYVLALSIIGILLYIPYAEVVYAHRLHFKLAAFCLIGVFVIFVSIIPRRDKFIEPGPRLNKADHSVLFNEIESIAKAVGQEMPKEVYLVPDVNAWVSNRGGIMGFGSRRVMGLGMPLLQILTVSQFRAVLAHEFGHYYSGDTKLAPWVYKTRSTIFRTLQGLADHSSVLQKPFLWYGKLFLRVSHAVSRAQEYTADKLAASIAGSENMISGLNAVYSKGNLYDAYWRNEVIPVLSSGFKPPIYNGFDIYLQSEDIQSITNKILENELVNVKNDPYSTHPCLNDRVKELQKLNYANSSNNNDELAITLIDKVDEMEKSLLLLFADKNKVNVLKSVDWDKTGEEVYVPAWKESVEKNTDLLKEITPLDMPKIAKEPEEFVKSLATLNYDESVSLLSQAAGVLGAAISIILYTKGWSVYAMPGEDIILTKGEEKIYPFKLLHDFSEGKLDTHNWEEKCISYGIDKTNLACTEVSDI